MESESNRDALALFAAVAIFLVVTASWVWHDARRRGARKPLLAAVLAIFQGPLWLAFYLADRPLCADERREGGFGCNFARNFALAWSIVNAPLVAIVLALALVSTMAPRALENIWTVMLGVSLWAGLPGVLALGIGRLVHNASALEQGGAASGRAGLSFGAMYTLASLALWAMIGAFVALATPN